MRKQPFLKIPGSFFVVITMIFASCNGSNSSSAQTDTLGTTAKMDSSKINIHTTLNGDLKTLWMNSSEFLQLQHSLSLKLNVDASGEVTLHGWFNDNTTFHHDRDIKIDNVISSVPPLPVQGSYLGNLTLGPNDRQSIQGKITSGGYRYVIFEPMVSSSNVPASGSVSEKYQGHIYYEIWLSNDNTRAPKMSGFTGTDTGSSLNPSPPAH